MPDARRGKQRISISRKPEPESDLETRQIDFIKISCKCDVALKVADITHQAIGSTCCLVYTHDTNHHPVNSKGSEVLKQTLNDFQKT